MKRYLLILLLPAALISCNVKKRDRISDEAARVREQGLKDSTTVLVIDTTHNFVKAVDGDMVEFNFRFKNTGNKPLIITNASASCGCTVPEKPELPILPGDTSFIKVVFNSKGRVGEAHKTVRVTSNARPEFPELVLTGEVVEKQ
jgi:hypothetical protein